MGQIHLLLIDDDEMVREGLIAFFEGSGWKVSAAANGAEARRALDTEMPDVVLLDVMLPDVTGLDLLGEIKAYSESLPVVMFSGAGSIDLAVEAIKEGAEHFVQKPTEGAVLEKILGSAAGASQARRQLVALARRADAGARPLLEISPQIEEMRQLVARVAKAPFPAMLLGESGTGKGLVARLLHDLSEHASAPYVDLNCAGLSHELLESELFGHERGAFTGAHAAKQGLLEVAAGGTLFLDEVGELTPSIQARLLKVIEEKTFRRVGGLRDLRVRVRLVAATNRDLRAEVEAGRFRRDLFFRLNVIAIEMPPLRERAQDIPLLVRRILDGLANDLGRGELRVSQRALRRLETYSWPGNVRELRNVLERAALLSAGDEIESSDLALSGPGTGARSSARDDELDAFRSLEAVVNEHVAKTVAATGGNLREAARRLEISPSTLYSRLRRVEKPK